MSNATHLLAAIYPNRDHAKTIADMLEKMRVADNINIADSSVVTKHEDGKIKIEETKELTTGKGARRGALIAGAFGLIFPPSLIASAVVGGAAGAIAGRIRDTGVKTDELKSLAEQLEPGQAMVVVLAHEDSLVAVQNALGSYEGKLVVAALDDDLLKEINVEQEWQDSTGNF